MQFSKRHIVPALALVISCASQRPESNDKAEPVAVNQFGQRYVESICPAIAACCAQNGFADDHQLCMKGAAVIQAAFVLRLNPGYVYDAQRAGTCFANIAADLATCRPQRDEEANADCALILSGSKPAGVGCQRSSDCAVGLVCIRQALGDICVRVEPPVAGAPCVPYDDHGERLDTSRTYGDCRSSREFYCDEVSRTCKPRGAAGANCSEQCNDATYCDGATEKCQPRKGPGATCSSTGECTPDLYCDAANACARKRAGGESCRPADECLYGCDAVRGRCRFNEIGRDLCAGERD